MTDLAHSYLSSVGIDVDDDAIEHYGKKGMKWGVRHDIPAAGGAGGGGAAAAPSRKERKAANDKAIMDARDRQRTRAVELERQAFKTYSANGEKAAAAALKKYDKMEMDLLHHPDGATAAKMTSGEKASAAVSWAIVGGLSVAAIGLRVAAQRL